MKVLTAAQMQRIDRLTTEQCGVPSLTLMENAGHGVVDFLSERFAPLSKQKITILCGRGNNGGDGLVVARLLRNKGLSPRVVLLGNPASLKGDAAVNYDRLAALGANEVVEDAAAWHRARPSMADSTLVIDAILGTGLSKPLEGFLLGVVRDLNTGFPEAHIVAVDLPTGISSDTGELVGECVKAEASVTFTAPKMGHVFPPACEYVGPWVVKPIGTPPDLLESDPELYLNLTCQEDLAWLTRPRKLTAHKGNFGHVLILAGSIGKTGAAALAAQAALRVGAGLVTVATPKSALPIIAGFAMEFMTEPLPETDLGTVSLRALDGGRMDKLAEGKSVLAIGPGLGNVAETAEFVRAVVSRYDVPTVLDADGLNAFAGRMDQFSGGGTVRVLTPHPGEMSRLTTQTIAEILARRIEAAREFATKYQVTLVLKGSRTLTASTDGRVAVNPTGNPGMAKGGSGDVLTGLVAGLLGQYPTLPVGQVVAASVYLHGLAGDLAAHELGQASMLAGDLLRALPQAFRTITPRSAASDAGKGQTR
jgi:ADP-dependent NAD(P)H-hydrate dehydratase / NAD(P)H-hydrate epimerase